MHCCADLRRQDPWKVFSILRPFACRYQSLWHEPSQIEPMQRNSVLGAPGLSISNLLPSWSWPCSAPGSRWTEQPLVQGTVCPAALILIAPTLAWLLPNSRAVAGGRATMSSRWLTANGIRSTVLALGLLAACETGWALIDPTGQSAQWLLLHRSVVAVAACVGVAAIYLVLLPRYANFSAEWNNCIRNAGSILAWSSVTAAAWILALESYSYGINSGAAPMAVSASIFVFGLLGAQVLTALRWADSVAERSAAAGSFLRERYVIAAEAGVFLLFAHGRLTIGGSSWLVGLTASTLAVFAALAWQRLRPSGLLRAVKRSGT